MKGWDINFPSDQTEFAFLIVTLRTLLLNRLYLRTVLFLDIEYSLTYSETNSKLAFLLISERPFFLFLQLFLCRIESYPSLDTFWRDLTNLFKDNYS
jgi:hypothetical protein